MDYQKKTVLLKSGRTCLLRRPEEYDAEILLDYLQATSAETPYMIREPEEVRTSVEAITTHYHSYPTTFRPTLTPGRTE